MASGHVNRINRPNTWLHRPMLQNVKKALANPEPSTHGTKLPSRDVRNPVATGGKPDIDRGPDSVAIGPGTDLGSLGPLNPKSQTRGCCS